LVKHGDPWRTISTITSSWRSLIADGPPGVDEGRPQPTQGLNYANPRTESDVGQVEEWLSILHFRQWW
jgi:hypothetical protein